MAVTIRDIATRLNLSKSTVSYALNGGPKPVSEDVRLRVEKAAREMGFSPNEVARSLALGRTKTIGFVPLSLEKMALTSPFVRTALNAVYIAGEDSRLHILLPTGYSACDPVTTRDRLFEARVDGVVLLATEDMTLLRHLSERNLPIAIVAGPTDIAEPTFNADNVGGARQVADHLVALGHRRIGMIESDLHGDVIERSTTFRARLREHGVEMPSEYLERGNLLPPHGYEAGQRLLSLEKRPSAIFCANDQMAYGLIQAAHERNLDVPRDLSVVGFDDDDLSESYSPSLTTVRQPVAEMARAAFEAVVQQIAGKPVNGVIFPTELIVRASTDRPTKDLAS